MKVVIIEDDPQAAAQLKKHLSRLGEETQTAFETAHYRDAEVYLEHCYGMKSIRMLTKKYGGDLRVNVKNKLFSLTLLFPLEK